MIVKIEIPELTLYPNGFPLYWGSSIFLTGNRARDYQVTAILSTYIRLVEAAFIQYKEARRLILKVWSNHSAIEIGAANHSATNFENCITSMHRSVLCMQKIRGIRAVPDDIKALFPKRPVFAIDTVANRLRDIRNTIQHLDDQVLNGTIPSGAPFTFLATGPESPVLESDQPGQTLKVIDRLAIGSNELLFSDIFNWLKEMGDCAEKISQHRLI